jgi:hypothetical protein
MMKEFTAAELGRTPTIEVTVFRHGVVIERELCESERDARAAVARWSEIEGVTCQVDDLAVAHREGQILEPVESVEVGEDTGRPGG